MKKFYSVACALAITFSAGSALALEKMDSKSKSDVTAQSGVTITLDDVVTDIEVASAGYTDDGGIGAGTATGSVYVTVGALTTTAHGTVTIDAGTVSGADLVTTGGDIADGTSFVKVGLTDMYSEVSNLNIGLYAGTATGTSTATGNFGSMQVNGFKTTTNGAIFIYPH